VKTGTVQALGRIPAAGQPGRHGVNPSVGKGARDSE
jgi:hypothetical protein